MILGKPVDVEQSILRGGKRCIFIIRVAKSAAGSSRFSGRVSLGFPLIGMAGHTRDQPGSLQVSQHLAG